MLLFSGKRGQYYFQDMKTSWVESHSGETSLIKRSNEDHCELAGLTMPSGLSHFSFLVGYLQLTNIPPTEQRQEVSGCW
jgi:hypothetical protein